MLSYKNAHPPNRCRFQREPALPLSSIWTPMLASWPITGTRPGTGH
jgi:hypothetical protein